MPNLDAIAFLSPSAIGSAIEVTVASIASPTELNSRAAAQGDIILARTIEAGTGTQTWYYADTTSDAESLPYIVSSATSGVKFIAIGGRYQNESINTASLTASRLIRTDASKNLESNAALISTYILYADTNGWPTGSASLTWNGTALTANGVAIGDTSGYGFVSLNGVTSPLASTIGIYGAGPGDDTLYVNTVTGGNISFRINNVASLSVEATLVTITSPATLAVVNATDASAVGTASVVLTGGLGVSKRSFLGTIGSTFKGNVLAGVQDATADTAGAVGEVTQGTNQTTYTNFTTTNTYQQLAVLTSLAPGRYRIVGRVTYYGNGATVAAIADATFAISTTTASAAGATEGRSLGYITQPVTSSTHITMSIDTDINISAATSYYLNGKANFTVSNPQYVASITAYRLR
jgi:hypothetical protein